MKKAAVTVLKALIFFAGWLVLVSVINVGDPEKDPVMWRLFAELIPLAVIERNGLWHMAPDNSDPHDFDENNGAPLDALAERMAGYFREYVKSAAEGPVREDAFLIREYSGSPESGMSDEDVLRLLRNA